MHYGYFNHVARWHTGRWGRYEWRHAWWRFYRNDPRWSPPDYSTFVHVTDPQRPHWQQVSQQALSLAALARSAENSGRGIQLATSAFSETTVAATLVQIDPSLEATAHLALLRCANDEETLERLLAGALSFAGEHGRTQLIGPTGLLPAWQSGALTDHFHMTPPLHTPYNPPYLSDVLAGVMEAWQETVLLMCPVRVAAPEPDNSIAVTGLEPGRLTSDCLDLLNEALNPDGVWPRLDSAAAALLLQMLLPYPMAGWVASSAGRPIGIALVQPDLAAVMRRAGGARNWVGRAYAAWAKRRPVRRGRLLLGAVARDWRGRGIGAQLWQHVCVHAAAAGWTTISAGPLVADGAGAAFLIARGAAPAQHYTTYAWSAW